MRTDQSAQFVATRPYRDKGERDRALYDHARRVVRARREAPIGELAKQPILTASGSVIFSGETAECLIGTHGAGAVFAADSTTHRVLNRNGESCTTWLCVRHWSDYKREENDLPGLPIGEVRYSRAIESD